MDIRHDWTREEIRGIYHLPLPELIFRAQTAHREFQRPDEVQLCRLLSIKTGGCPEDCAYCSQSAHYKTDVAREELMDPVDVLEAAKRAKSEGATRFCMGAAWRQVTDGKDFERVLEMVRAVAALDMEVCCTLGMLTESQARRLKKRGADGVQPQSRYVAGILRRTSSRRASTRTGCRRLRTCARRASRCAAAEFWEWVNPTRTASGCCTSLARLDPHPESVPINMLVRERRNAAGGRGGTRSAGDGARRSRRREF